MKFSFGIRLPLSISAEGTTWAVDGAQAHPFPAAKGPINLNQGNPNTLALQKNGAGVAFTFPQKTWTQVQDQRAWGKETFVLAYCYYFPGKVTAPEINYRLIIGAP
ncbi:MAG: hypothetical protein PHQ12_05540 [Chthoniobacteraceae bacterium]|nr:hypothetical protein [Chthoniobacteraceae bacterium]